VRTRAAAIVGSILFFFVAPGVVAGWIPYAFTGWRLEPPLLGLASTRIAGGAIVVIGVAALVDCFRRFAIEGLGTPAAVAPAVQLVVSGLYRYVRNPMYLAVTSIISGQALVFGSATLLGYAGVVWLVFHLFVLGYEEPALRARFGDSYGAYRSQVRRWWPRLTPWEGR
jgi:protein-S-isoprenylcysteine O-methyltransferase Ste14